MKQVLAGKTPAARADELVAGTKLVDPAERKRLVDGGKKAIDASDDPMIVLAQAIDAEARKLRKRYENEVEEPERQAYAEIAEVRFDAFGKTRRPGRDVHAAAGVRHREGLRGRRREAAVPHHVRRGVRAGREARRHSEPFDLPKRWLDGKDKLDLTTPFNFVSTADTIGGNSGSPVLNRAGELVGINFDRNRHGLVRNFVYTDVQARHIAVHSRAVLEALRKLYPAESLVKELTGK